MNYDCRLPQPGEMMMSDANNDSNGMSFNEIGTAK